MLLWFTGHPPSPASARLWAFSASHRSIAHLQLEHGFNLLQKPLSQDSVLAGSAGTQASLRPGPISKHLHTLQMGSVRPAQQLPAFAFNLKTIDSGIV